MTKPSDDAVKLRAYELWEARGKLHGADRDDWFRASEQLRSKPDAGPFSAVQILTEGMFSVASLAITAATHAAEGLFGSGHPKEKVEEASAAKAAIPSPQATVSDQALESAERRLQVDADQRVREAATKAGAST